MPSEQFNITFSRIALQVWIMVLIPSSFVLVPLLILLNFDLAEWLFMVIIFSFVFLSWWCTITLIARCTRKALLEADENGIKITFTDSSIFYERFNGTKISWAEVDKMAFNYDLNHDLPYIVFRFSNATGNYICMGEDSKGLDESNWPLWLSLDQYAKTYDHMHRKHRIKRSNFLDSGWFKFLLWVLTLLFLALIVYKLVMPAQAPAWYQTLRLLVILIPLHALNMKHQNKIRKAVPGRNSDTHYHE